MKKHLFSAALLLCSALPAFAASVALQGMIGKSALLVIDGGAPRAVAPGQTLHGVKVIATQGDEATIEVDGERLTLRVGDAPSSFKGKGTTSAKSNASGSANGAASCRLSTAANAIRSDNKLADAIRGGDEEGLRCLLDAGADVNATDRHDATPLMHAAHEGDTAAARLLLDRGANVNTASRVGATALMVAAYYGQADMVRLLIERGADVDARNKNGDTPLALAQRGRGGVNPDIIQMLRDAGATE